MKRCPKCDTVIGDEFVECPVCEGTLHHLPPEEPGPELEATADQGDQEGEATQAPSTEDLYAGELV